MLGVPHRPNLFNLASWLYGRPQMKITSPGSSRKQIKRTCVRVMAGPAPSAHDFPQPIDHLQKPAFIACPGALVLQLEQKLSAATYATCTRRHNALSKSDSLLHFLMCRDCIVAHKIK